MAAAEYDVLVNLKVSRESQRAMAASGGAFRGVMRQAERDQQRMNRAELGRIRSTERERMRALGAEGRARRQHERLEVAANRSIARAEQRRHAESARAARRAAMESTRSRAATMSALGGTSRGTGNLFAGAGTGGAGDWAKSAGLVITGILAGAVAAGLAKGLASGFEDNIKREQRTGGIATTLQLYDFNATDEKGGARDEGGQFAENLENAKWYQEQLQTIADRSPGDVEQVNTLFQGMLPGMASVTQDAQRIVDLTQKATLLSAVLDNDFKTVGAQSSRILTGGAGAEFETWNRLQKPIRQAGIEMGVFNKNQKLGTALTEKFNKLQPEQRLKLFEKGLERLGKPVADYYENTFDGIVSQAKSSWITIRRQFGAGPFEAVKDSVRGLNKGQGILARGSQANKNAMEFAGYLGKRLGEAVSGAIGLADRATTYVANNWETIVVKAQLASHYLIEGAKVAVGLMGVRTGVGLAAGGVGGLMKGGAALASTISNVAALGAASLIAVPAMLALGVVTAGAGILFGGMVTYVVSNLDDLAGRFTSWTQTAGDVIDPFFVAVDTISAKFEAMGAYLLGASDQTDIFTTIASGATTVVETLTSVFSELIGMTAGVIEGFAGAADFIAGMTGGRLGDTVLLNQLYDKRGSMGADQMNTEAYGRLSDDIEALEEKTRTYTERAAGVVSTIRGAKAAYDNAGPSGVASGLSYLAYEKMFPMGPAKPPTSRDPKIPPVKVTQNIKVIMNVRDGDPNAIVAGPNRMAGSKAAQPIKSALALIRRG